MLNDKNIKVYGAMFLFDYSIEQINVLTQVELKSKYHTLVRKHHTDTGGSNEFFVKINESYKTLTNFIVELEKHKAELAAQRKKEMEEVILKPLNNKINVQPYAYEVVQFSIIIMTLMILISILFFIKN